MVPRGGLFGLFFFPNIEMPASNRGAFLMLSVFVFSFSVINLKPKVHRFEFLSLSHSSFSYSSSR